MPNRGRPDRPSSSTQQGSNAFDRETARGAEFGLGIYVDDSRFSTFDLRVGVADRQSSTFDLRVGVADRRGAELPLAVGVMDWAGNAKTQDLFGVGISVGEGAGYAAPPRLAIPGALSLGQEVRRRGEPIPVVD